MTQASGERRTQRLARLWCGLLAVVLALLGGVVRAEPSSAAAWALDLLARVEQQQSAGGAEMDCRLHSTTGS